MAMMKLKIRGYIFYVLSVILLVAPIISWFIYKQDVYFRAETPSLSVGAMLGLFSLVLMLKGAFKDIDKRFATVFWISMGMGITYFAQSILDDLFYIMGASLVGYVLYIGVNSYARRVLEFNKEYRLERARISARKASDSVGNV